MNVNLDKNEIVFLLGFFKKLSEDVGGDIPHATLVQEKLEHALDIIHEAEELACSCLEKHGYDLSENQLKFVQDALLSEFEVNFTYSGRGMFGRKCPCVCLERGETFSSEAETCIDSMGLGSVVYAKD